MLFNFKIICILLVFSVVLINAKNYNNRKTTPKPMTPKPTKAPSKTTPKPPTPPYKPPNKPTQKPKPTTAAPTKPSKPSYGGNYGGMTGNNNHGGMGGGNGGMGGGNGGMGGGNNGGMGGSSKPEPYHFAYEANVGSPDPTGMISQSESGDGNGVVTGTVYNMSSYTFLPRIFVKYSLRDPDGRERTVIYRADSTGFHATVETNELPPDVPNPADVTIIGSGPAPSMGSPGSTSGPSSGSQSGSSSGYYYQTTGGSTEGSTTVTESSYY